MLKRYIIIGLLALLIIPFIYSLNTKNYKKSNIDGDFYSGEDIEFLYDLTYMKDGEIKKEQNIFEEELKIIEEAEDFLILDLFLYNDEYDREKMDFKNQIKIMTDKLIENKKLKPELEIIFITDELNNFYGAYSQEHIERLITEGIDVNIVNLDNIRDSNPLYSGFYRFYIKWLGVSEGGYIKNLFDPKGPKINIRSFLRLLNFKANHRKVIISENCALVTSANPHDPSSNHSNVGLKFYGKAMEDLIKSELRLVEKEYPKIEKFKAQTVKTTETKLRVITEGKIYEALKNNLDSCESGDEVNIGIFYIADMKLLKDIENAAKRGAKINIIADLNKDAFGIEKNGSPNRPALTELVEENPNINVRWYETHGEQYHTKMAYFNYKTSKPKVILGSANFTRRNLQNYNLETDLELILTKDSGLHIEIENYFNRLWNNTDGNYTTDFDVHREDGFILRHLWKLQEFSGLCTW